MLDAIRILKSLPPAYAEPERPLALSKQPVNLSDRGTDSVNDLLQP
jgi:hypothetical protein